MPARVPISPLVLHDGVMAPLSSRVLTSAATGVVGAGVALGLTSDNRPQALVSLAGAVAVLVAWVVVAREPSSPVGPALAWSSAGVATSMVIDVLAGSAYTAHPLPLAAVARPIWVGSWPITLVGVFALVLVFPDGRSPHRLWRVLPWLYAAGTFALVLGEWGARELNGRIVGESSDPVRTVTGTLGAITVGGCLVLGVVGIIVRYRAGNQHRREQIRWLLLAGLATVTLLVLGWVAQALGAPLEVSYAPFLTAIVVLVPLAVGTAMVRHDLFDIDRILGASTAWILTLLVSAAVFGAVVIAMSRLVGARSGLGPAAAAFVTALVLLPLQRHIAAVVGRAVDHDRHVALAGIEAFVAEVRAGRRAPEEVEDVLREAQRDPKLRLFLARPDGVWVDLAGHAVDEPGGFAVRSGGDTIATIVLGHESARARRRIAEFARAGWVPVEVSRLRLVLREALEEVRASRARLTTTAATERRRLERDLHDGAQQRLVATGMRLRSLQQGLDQRRSAEVDRAVAELEGTVAELRRLAQGVRPSRLDDGLRPALEAVRADSPIPLHLVVEDLPELDETRALTAFLVVSEAVTNALKHAQSTRIDVRVGHDSGRVAVVVRDDGIGGASPLGLTTLRDRVHSLGGTLCVESPPGQGTTVQAVL